MTKKKQIAIWWRWVNFSIVNGERLSSLKMSYRNLADSLFVERVQDTSGFFKVRVLDFVEPTDWKIKEPCTVTIYRKGHYDIWSDEIFNEGTDKDVKTFCCPDYKDGKKCDQTDCLYCGRNNKYVELEQKIPHAQEIHDKIVSHRQAAWQAIWAKTK